MMSGAATAAIADTAASAMSDTDTRDDASPARRSRVSMRTGTKTAVRIPPRKSS
jgi:hypothetical protein